MFYNRFPGFALIHKYIYFCSIETIHKPMISTKIYHSAGEIDAHEKEAVIDFLYKHLDEFGDPREDIEKAVNFALKAPDSEIGKNAFGGFVVVGRDQDEIAGAVIINRTGMSGYIPENILVYIATNSKMRGKGVGKQLMKETLDEVDGDVALHVEADNPAKYLYEKVGFTNPYLEMRYKKS